MVKSRLERTETYRVHRSAWSLLRGALPAVAVATLIPLALFYLVLAAGGVVWAIAVSILYAYGVAVYQFVRRRRVSGMLLVTVFMATVKGVAAVLSGHMMVYFAVPVVETAGFGLMFAATMFTSEPLVVRLARDLIPHAADDLAGRHALHQAPLARVDRDLPGKRRYDTGLADHGLPARLPRRPHPDRVVLDRLGPRPIPRAPPAPGRHPAPAGRRPVIGAGAPVSPRRRQPGAGEPAGDPGPELTHGAGLYGPASPCDRGHGVLPGRPTG